MRPDIETSPQVYARTGGWLYLFIIVAGTFTEVFVHGRLIVSGDPAATVRNIAASEQLWRTGIAAEMLMWVCAVALALIFYVLLRPVNRNLALLLVFFNVMDTAVESGNALCNFAALFFSKGGGYLAAFDARQLQALAAQSLRLHEYGFGIGLVFFGVFLMLLSYLIVRARYFPKWLGILVAVGGVCYLVNSFTLFLAPALEDVIFPAILLPSFVAELSLCLWLIVMGINVPKWREATLGVALRPEV